MQDLLCVMLRERFNLTLNRPMTEIENIYNDASRRNKGLHGHYSGLVAVFEHGRQIERADGIDRMLDEMLRRA